MELVTFEQAVKDCNPAVRKLAKEARKLILDVYPQVVEVAWPRQGTIGYGVGPKKMSEHFCYLDLYRNHLNLGFNHGAVLPDPAKLLQGQGKRFRHIKIESEQDLKRPQLRALLEALVRERKTSPKGVKR